MPAITFSLPTTFAYRTIRSATVSGCSRMFVLCVTTPGITARPSGSTRPSQTFHSCSCWGFAASNEYWLALIFTSRSMTSRSGKSVLCGPTQLPQQR